MNKKVLNLLLTMLMSMVGLQAFAAWDTSTKIEVDGLYYYLDNVNNLAQVTSMPSGRYTGNITIPSSFTYNTTNYSVTSIGMSAFNTCTNLASITIPNSVTSIGMNAFTSCTSLTSVTIPNSVTSIGVQAFYNCSSLTSVTIGGGSIGGGAFDSCTNLASVIIGSGVTSIESYAFRLCNLSSITVDGENPTLDSRDNCNAVINSSTNELVLGCKNTIIPNTVTSIYGGAFAGCTGLTSITIPSSVTSIGNAAFEGCSGLTTITIPSSVTTIGFGTGVFDGCTSMTSIKVMHEDPISIYPQTLNYLYSRAKLYVPAGSKSAYKAANNWKEFGTIVDHIVFADANVKAICVAHWDTDGDGELSTDEAAAVTTISDYFKNNTSITSFDEFAYFTGVTTIGILAFDGCSQLASITLPEGLTDIWGYAFRGCALTSISIPSTVTSIEGSFLANCDDITHITVDNGNTMYDSRNNCNAIITTIDRGIGFPANMLITGCKNTSIPNTVTTIGGQAFYGCSGLTSINLPSSVIRIEGGAFYGCSGLTSIYIPSNVTDIDNNTNLFGKCDALTSITVEYGNAKYDSRKGCNAIIETSTNTLVSACNNTVIPNDVTSIGLCAFEDCTEMTSITIPNSVTSIGWWAFRGCSGLASVISEIEEPFAFDSGELGAFNSISSSCTLTVPYGTRDAYIAAGWTTDVFKGGIVEKSSENINMSANEIGTYCCDYDLDFSGVNGLKAYIMSGFSPSTSTLVLTPVTMVPAGTGLLLKGAEGNYEVPCTTTDMYYTNLLKGVTTATAINPTDGEYTNFILSNGKHGIGFYTLSESGELAANKAYLQLPTASVASLSRAMRLVFADDITGIDEKKAETKKEDNIFYDLQGRRVDNPTQGLYIVNGKKVFINK